MHEMTLTLNSPITEEQWDAITDVDLEHTNDITFYTKHGKEVKFVKASAQPEIIRCKDCKYFEYDHPYIIQGIPVLGHEVCNAWGGGCKTDENGYCFMAERRAEKEEVTA